MHLKGALLQILKFLGLLLLVPILYFLFALIATHISVGEYNAETEAPSIFISSNGVHLDIILPVELMTPELKAELNISASHRFISFGWGDKEFYLNTPEWKDLKVSTALSAMFLNSPTLMHISRYRSPFEDWLGIKVNEEQIEAINLYLLNSFSLDEEGRKRLLADRGYSWYDDFYEAKGNYHCFHTCNSWVNTAFKRAKLKACLWTPFDFGLMGLYEKKNP